MKSLEDLQQSLPENKRIVYHTQDPKERALLSKHGSHYMGSGHYKTGENHLWLIDSTGKFHEVKVDNQHDREKYMVTLPYVSHDSVFGRSVVDDALLFGRYDHRKKTISCIVGPINMHHKKFDRLISKVERGYYDYVVVIDGEDTVLEGKKLSEIGKIQETVEDVQEDLIPQYRSKFPNWFSIGHKQGMVKLYIVDANGNYIEKEVNNAPETSMSLRAHGAGLFGSAFKKHLMSGRVDDAQGVVSASIQNLGPSGKLEGELLNKIRAAMKTISRKNRDKTVILFEPPNVAVKLIREGRLTLEEARVSPFGEFVGVLDHSGSLTTRLFESSDLKEGKVNHPKLRSGSYFENPSPDQAVGLYRRTKSVRFFEMDGTLYMWNGFDMIHEHFAMKILGYSKVEARNAIATSPWAHFESNGEDRGEDYLFPKRDKAFDRKYRRIIEKFKSMPNTRWMDKPGILVEAFSATKRGDKFGARNYTDVGHNSLGHGYELFIMPTPTKVETKVYSEGDSFPYHEDPDVFGRKVYSAIGQGRVDDNLMVVSFSYNPRLARTSLPSLRKAVKTLERKYPKHTVLVYGSGANDEEMVAEAIGYRKAHSKGLVGKDLYFSIGHHPDSDGNVTLFMVHPDGKYEEKTAKYESRYMPNHATLFPEDAQKKSLMWGRIEPDRGLVSVSINKSITKDGSFTRALKLLKDLDRRHKDKIVIDFSGVSL